MQHSDAHLLIVGDGRQKKHLMQLCNALKIEERVHFTGYVSIEQGLPELYRIACMFVTASEIETQGIVLLEAAASGLPLIAVHATCIAEIVYDGANGYMTEAGDVYAMCQSVIKILADPQKAASMGRVSRRLAEGHPNQATFNEHERMYQQMVVEHGTQKTSATRRAYLQWKQLKKRLIWVFTGRF
jgi:glycosyltransferase involved in cell wall biosynthesis